MACCTARRSRQGLQQTAASTETGMHSSQAAQRLDPFNNVSGADAYCLVLALHAVTTTVSLRHSRGKLWSWWGLQTQVSAGSLHD
jgi:hypothetical protein